jgi:hypothetical protein
MADETLIAAMLAALRLAIVELREDLETLVECNSVKARRAGAAWSSETALPADLDDDVRHIAQIKKAALDAVKAAIARAEGR